MVRPLRSGLSNLSASNTSSGLNSLGFFHKHLPVSANVIVSVGSTRKGIIGTFSFSGSLECCSLRRALGEAGEHFTKRMTIHGILNSTGRCKTFMGGMLRRLHLTSVNGSNHVGDSATRGGGQ